MPTWLDRGGVAHAVVMGRPKDGRRLMWVTQCDGSRAIRRELRQNLKPTCIECILEED